MKATGMVRRLDDLGRVVIPKEMRTGLGLKEGDPVEFYVDHEGIVVRPYRVRCVFCGEEHDLIERSRQKVCRNCIAALSNAVAND